MDNMFNFNSKSLFEILEKSTDDYIYICKKPVGADMTVISRKMAEEFDLPSGVIKHFGELWIKKIHPSEQKLFYDAYVNMLEGLTDVHSVEYRVKNVHGEWVWLRCKGYLKRDENGVPDLFAGMIINLGRKSKVDNITGMLNKYAFEDNLSIYISSEENKTGLMILNIDNFKNINSLYNRRFGDNVLKIIAHKIQTVIPVNAELYRLDNDEFAVIFRNSSYEEMRRTYFELKNVFDIQQEYDGKKYSCTFSGGAVMYCDIPKASANYQTFMKYAVAALDYAKSHGKKRINLFNSDMLEAKTRELSISEALRESIENNFEGFQIVCQPQVCASTGELKGGEALLRWHNSEFGNVSPVEFVPILENTGMIVDAGKWIFKEAVKLCGEWLKYCPDFKMSINISYIQLFDDNFIDFVSDTIRNSDADFSNIIIELTESRFVTDKEFLNNMFSNFRKMGISIAMDDFGTGYSSLEVLKEVPADIVKIDRAFVKNIKESIFDKNFIRFAVELCHNVGIKVCLEGIENIEEYKIVHDMNLDFIQGYFFGKPQIKEDFQKNHFKNIKNPVIS